MSTSIATRRIVVAGGGVDALAVLLALRDLGEGAFAITLVARALMPAGQVRGMGREPEISFITPEAAPRHVFGPEASAAVAELFDEAGITVHCGAPVAVGRDRISFLHDGDDISVQRIVSL